jgi:hypothetical protein
MKRGPPGPPKKTLETAKKPGGQKYHERPGGQRPGKDPEKRLKKRRFKNTMKGK